MSWDWNPDPARTVLLDLETQSASNLKAVGTKGYLRCPTTRLLSLVALVEGRVVVWVPPGRAPAGIDVAALWPEGFAPLPLNYYCGETPPAPILDAIHRGYTFAAHNAQGFDAEAYRLLVGGPQPAAWYDTIPCARAAGLPGALDALGKRFLGRGKDDEGSRALRLLFTVKLKVRGGNETLVYPVGTPQLWQKMLRYNVADVLLLRRVFDEVAPFGEVDVLHSHSAVNARGIYIDRGFLDALDTLWQEAQRQGYDRVAQLTGGALNETNLRSGPQVHRWLRSQGLDLQSLNRTELTAFYEDPEDFFSDADSPAIPIVIEVLKARQAAVRGSPGKIKAARAMMDADNRVRDWANYHAAHTGRWSGRGLQPHNLPRGVKIDAAAVFEAYLAGTLNLDTVRAAAPAASLDDALASLFRPVLAAAPGNRLGIVDFAGIEARGIAWVARQLDLLETFARGGDVYCDMASSIFGRTVTKSDGSERQIGKVVVLGCGYQMSARKFAAYCELQRIDLAAAGVTGDSCVKAYRTKNDRIVAVWRDYNRAAFDAVETKRVRHAGRCTFGFRDGCLVIRLPSGRELVYRDARIEDRVPPYCRALGIAEDPRPTLCYTKPIGFEGHLYGGLLAENIVQAICRDLLATALVRCEAENLPVVLHVHDEIVIEVPAADSQRSLDRLAEIMTDPPSWAAGFPVAVEGFDGERYTKSAFKGAHHVNRTSTSKLD